MTTDIKNEIADLKHQLAMVKAALAPTPNDAAAIGAWRDQMRGFDEARASAMPPSVVRDWAVIPDHVVRAVGCRDARAPTGRPGVIPSQAQPVSNTGGGPPMRGTGWIEPAPLSNPPGTHLVDALCIVDDLKQRAERKR